MDIVDAHHHFWNYDVTDYPWIDDSLAVLKRDFGCADLVAASEQCGVAGVVSVQARTISEETDYLLAEGERCPLVKGVVGWAPLKDSGVGEMLDNWLSNHLFKGVREICQGEPDGAFFDNEDFNRGIRALTARSLPYDLLLFEDQLKTVIRFVDRHPNQKFIVDHIAKPVIQHDTFALDWAQDLKELGSRDNVVGCKFSGVVTEVRDTEWDASLLQPYFDAAVKAFGMHRLMFGSDWPVCLSRTTYRRWVETVHKLAGDLSSDEAGRFFVKNATDAYGLESAPQSG